MIRRSQEISVCPAGYCLNISSLSYNLNFLHAIYILQYIQITKLRRLNISFSKKNLIQYYRILNTIYKYKEKINDKLHVGNYLKGELSQ